MQSFLPDYVYIFQVESVYTELHTVSSFLRDSLLDTFYSLQTFQKIDGNLVKSAYRVEMTITYDLTLREQVSI